jgi:hypothetical protein
MFYLWLRRDFQEMEQIIGTGNCFNRKSWKIQRTITVNEFDIKTYAQVDFACFNHSPNFGVRSARADPNITQTKELLRAQDVVSSLMDPEI